MTIGAEYLIIAGDISDNLNNSINYVSEVTGHYDKVLWLVIMNM